MAKHPFSVLDKPREEKEYFGDKFLFSGEGYPHADWTLIAKTETSEGQTIEVYISSWPARFWKFRIICPGQPNIDLSTGSGSWYDYKAIYELLIKDMLGAHIPKTKSPDLATEVGNKANPK